MEAEAEATKEVLPTFQSREPRESGEAVYVNSPPATVASAHGHRSLFVSTIPKATPGGVTTVAPPSPLSPAGTWPETTDRSERKDSAWNSSASTDNEDTCAIVRHPTNEDPIDHNVLVSASGTMPVRLISQVSLETRNQQLEERVTELQARVKQLELEKKESQKLLIDKTSDTEKTNRELRETLGKLHVKENEVDWLRDRLDSLKEEHTNFHVTLTQRLEYQADMIRKYEEEAVEHKEQAKLYREKYELEEEKAKQAEEKANQYKGKAAVMEQNIKKMVKAISCRQGQITDMETNLDSLESRESEDECSSDST